MPTGGGKSLCFQVPALVKEGICIVISPLIALMKDQVQNLRDRGVMADAIYSGMHRKEIDIIFENAIYGNTKLLYLSPERLETELAIARIQKMNVNLIAVDESHCISQWGFDFRPSYLKINELKELCPDVPFLALTATATDKVINDIQTLLEIPKEHLFTKSFERTNLSYIVRHCEGKREKLLDILNKTNGCGIVYARNRKKTKEIAYFLRKNKISADFYHAGLSSEVRSKKQDSWVKNEIRVIVSTNAFGMGIDKPDVRIVVHMDMPDSLEAYFQEAGRAGRDGEKSYAVLLYNESDKMDLERAYEISYPEISEIKRVYSALGSYFQVADGSPAGRSYDFDLIEFKDTYQLDLLKTFNCLKILEKEGWIALSQALYDPSALKILVNKETLYDYQIRNQKMDLLIKTLLRAYHGLFTNYNKINEQNIANHLKTDRANVVKHIEKLANDNLVHYIPQKTKPQLTYLMEKVPVDNLAIDSKRLKFLKVRHRARLDAAIEYATILECRSALLLKYFGQENAPKCGLCDVCLEHHKKEVNHNDFQTFQLKIKRLLNKEELTIGDVVASFNQNQEKQILTAIQVMIDEGILGMEGEKLFLTD